MAEYIAREWSNGDIVTASNLNSMEQGIAEAQNDESSGSGALIIGQDTEASTSTRIVFDKTWQEVYNALKNGTRVIVVQEMELPPTVIVSPVVGAANNTSNSVAPYQIAVINAETIDISVAYADTADGYLYRTISSGGGGTDQ